MVVNFEALLDTIGKVSDAAVAAGEVAQALPWTRPAYQQWCRIMAGTGVPQALNAVDVPTICQPYLDDDGRGFGEVTPPFTGGQCPGVTYNGTVTVKVNGVTISTSNFTNQVGPLTVKATGNGTTSKGEGLFNGNNQFIAGATDSSPPFDEISVTPSGIVRSNGAADTCGDPPGVYVPGDGYDGEDYGEPFDFTDGNGRTWNINLNEPFVDIDGSINIPVEIDGIEFNIGGRSPEAPPAGESGDEGKPDFDNPSDPVRPGDPGQPEDGVNFSGEVACAIVVVTQTPINASQEIGGPENIFISGYASDAGWFRFRKGTATTMAKRLTGRSTIDCYCCSGDEVADGFQVKFSYGYDGYVVIIPPITTT